MNLKYSICSAASKGEHRHPQEVMRDLGITYIHATPQSMGEQWWFWGCRGIPEVLPEHISELRMSPRDAVGWGLSRADAEKIERWAV